MTHLTLWPSLYDTKNSQARTFTSISDLSDFFSRHQIMLEKDKATGFGPYRLRPQGTRKDADVLELTCGVFDVDTFRNNPSSEMEHTLALLVQNKVPHIWYSTFSNSSEKPSFRLVVPFSGGLDPLLWPSVRAHMLDTFQIPADPKKCSGASHFYYMPSAPPGGDTSFSSYLEGELYVPPKLPPLSRQGRPLYSGSSASRSVQAGPVDLGVLRAALEKRANTLSRGRTPDRKQKADLLRKLLRGESLGQHGERNHNAFVTAGVVAWALPTDTPIEAMLELFRQSLEAMQADGSSLTEDEIERALDTAAEKHAAQEDADNKLKAALERLRTSYIPTQATAAGKEE